MARGDHLKSSDPGPILVTGSSSGIGRTLVEFLSSRGHSVFAGARKETDLRDLSNLPNVAALRLDVADSEDVQRVVEWVQGRGEGLYGLVNNAGVSGFGSLIDSSVEDLHRVYDVNLYGMHRMTRLFAPLLIKSKGRIVNISSVSGFLIDRFWGAYNISKHAVEAYSDTLREELAQFGVSVSTIEPGDFRSEIDANCLRLVKREEVAKSRYSKELTKFIESRNSPDVLHRVVYPSPEKVAEAVSEALFSADPKSRYLVGNRSEAIKVVECLLETLAQVNNSLESSLTREQLAKMLDEFLD